MYIPYINHFFSFYLRLRLSHLLLFFMVHGLIKITHKHTEKEFIHNQDKCVVITADLDGFPVVIIWRHVAEVPLE